MMLTTVKKLIEEYDDVPNVVIVVVVVDGAVDVDVVGLKIKKKKKNYYSNSCWYRHHTSLSLLHDCCRIRHHYRRCHY
jgi:hypothetical protein